MLIEAIVIKRVPTREHDQLVTLYSAQMGKVTAVAKSALKSHSLQALQLDSGNHIQCELVSGRATPIITGAQAVRCFSNAKTSAPGLAVLQFFLQVIDAIVYEHESDPQLWQCLVETLDAIDHAEPRSLLRVFRYYQCQLLSVLGYGSVAVPNTHVSGRTSIDDIYEQIAQRRLGTLDLVYDLAR